MASLIVLVTGSESELFSFLSRRTALSRARAFPYTRDRHLALIEVCTGKNDVYVMCRKKLYSKCAVNTTEGCATRVQSLDLLFEFACVCKIAYLMLISIRNICRCTPEYQSFIPHSLNSNAQSITFRSVNVGTCKRALRPGVASNSLCTLCMVSFCIFKQIKGMIFP